MQTIDAAEAASRLPDLLLALRSGGEFTITRDGTPVARLVAPRAAPEPTDVTAAIERMQHFTSVQAPRLDAREIWVGGRRY